MSDEITDTIARVRRLMPRNGLVMSICEEVERLQAQVRELRKANTKEPVDRAAYMRAYMKQYRKGGRRGSKRAPN